MPPIILYIKRRMCMENILNPQTQSIEIFSLMLSGEIKLSVKARKYVFYMYLLLFGSCTREMVPLLLGAADKSNHSSGCKINYTDAKMTDNFISNRLKSKDILRMTVKNRILYKLTPKGYKELSNFLSGQQKVEGMGSTYIKWCDTDACGVICKNSVHSSAVGIIFIHIALRCSFTATDFKLNTPLDQHGNIRTGMFDQSKNRFRSDAYLKLCQPCRQEFFFENDMGTEREDAVAAKLERYAALIFSAERDLCRTSVHFTVGDYHTNKGYMNLRTPSKYTMQVYRSCVNVLLAAAGINTNMPVSTDKTTDFLLSYPNLRHGGINAYMKLIEKHIHGFSYRGKYTEIHDSDLITERIIQSSLKEYDNICFFQAGVTYYPFANCYSLHHNKGSFRYSFENISNDISARMRIERYLNDGAPDIPFLQIFVVYSDDIYSLKYVESLKTDYGIPADRQTNIHFEQLQYKDWLSD